VERSGAGVERSGAEWSGAERSGVEWSREILWMWSAQSPHDLRTWLAAVTSRSLSYHSQRSPTTTQHNTQHIIIIIIITTTHTIRNARRPIMCGSMRSRFGPVRLNRRGDLHSRPLRFAAEDGPLARSLSRRFARTKKIRRRCRSG